MTWLDNLSLRNLFSELTVVDFYIVFFCFFFKYILFFFAARSYSRPSRVSRLSSSRHCLVCVYLIFIDLQQNDAETKETVAKFSFHSQ